MAKFSNKISDLISKQVPEFVLSEHPKFLEFVKTYFLFMESAEVTLTDIDEVSQILLETETTNTNFLLLDGTNNKSDNNGDTFILEDSTYGDFQKGETITGSTSGATSVILAEDIETNSRLFIQSQDKFIVGETITGSTSGARAKIGRYRGNPVQNIQSLLEYASKDKTIDDFLINFQKTYLETLPKSLATGIDKRLLIQNAKSLYRAKGTKRSLETFFKLLFNEEATITFPKEQMLRASDGIWTVETILRCRLVNALDNPGYLESQTITQSAAGAVGAASAIVEEVREFSINGETIVELKLDPDSVDGTFVTGTTIQGISSNDPDAVIKVTVATILNQISITNDGALYTTSDTVTITGGGTNAAASITELGTGGVTSIVVETAGTGYEIGDSVTASGSNQTFQGYVAITNGSIASETDGDTIILEDATTDNDIYTGNLIVQESGTGVGDITKVRIADGGNGYSAIPTLTITSTLGADAELTAFGPEIGRIEKIDVTNVGIDYDLSPSPPTITLSTKLQYKDRSGNFTLNETITGGTSGATAVLSAIDDTSKVMTLTSVSGTFETDETLTGSSSSQTATSINVDLSTATSTVDTVVTKVGFFTGQTGFISENAIKIQDSLLYQDYSYLVKVGRSINDWRNALESTVHPSGFYYQNEIGIETRLNARIKSPVDGVVSGVEDTPIFSILNTLFTTVFGRRLGTTTDGTSARATPEDGVDPDMTDSTPDLFTSNTRDVTLTSSRTIQMGSIPHITVRGEEFRRGYAYAGPRLSSINKNVFGVFSSTDAGAASGTTISVINNLKLSGFPTSGSAYGQQITFQDYANSGNLKTNFAFPAEITT